MNKLNTTPGKIRNLLTVCLLGMLLSFGAAFCVYGISRNTAKTVGIDTVPNIIASQNIKATLADAHSNAMNAMVTGEKLGGKFWNLYRKDLDSLHSQLVDASENISYGDEERIPLTAISSNISAYEYTVGGAVANGAQISVDQFMEANRLMQQKILPASTALNRVNLTQLESTFNSYTKNINILIAVMLILGFGFLAVLIIVQVYLFRRTHRIFNAGLLLAAVLFSASLIYSTSTLNSVKKDLITAKQDAFDSINALWNARAAAYNAKSIESLYLLHEGTGIVQTADNINFDLSASRLHSDPQADRDGEKFVGYLDTALSNITFSGEKDTAETALSQWAKYVEANKKVRSLEYDSKHAEAIALSVGADQGQSGYEFGKFDEAIGNTIKINQDYFNSNIDSAFKTLNRFPFILSAFLVLIAASCMLGMKARIDEYKI